LNYFNDHNNRGHAFSDPSQYYFSSKIEPRGL